MTTRTIALFTVLFCAFLGQACSTSHEAATPCEEGGQYVDDDVVQYCAYVVVKGGFQCPEAFSHRIDIGEGAVCSSVEVELPELPPSVCVDFDAPCGSGALDGGLEHEFVCSNGEEAVEWGPFDEDSTCELKLDNSNFDARLDAVTVTNVSDRDVLVKFELHNCPAMDDSCHCFVAVNVQSGFDALFRKSPLSGTKSESVSMSIFSESESRSVEIRSARPGWQVLFAYNARTSVMNDDRTVLPFSVVSTSDGRLVADVADPVGAADPAHDVGIGVCAYGEESADMLQTGVVYFAPGESETGVPTKPRVKFDQSANIAAGGERFLVWIRDSGVFHKDEEGYPKFFLSWIAIPAAP